MISSKPLPLDLPLRPPFKLLRPNVLHSAAAGRATENDADADVDVPGQCVEHDFRQLCAGSVA